MKINSFEDLLSWQKAEVLAVDVYKLLANQKDFSFKDQAQRSAVSIMNNIAEGFERGGNKEMKYFLYIAKGSCGELRSMLRLGQKLEYFTEDQTVQLIASSVEISKLLSGLIKKL